jgi:hypothetical protein
MSDDHELSPEQERVRRLLAQARVEDPMPDDVAERLDRVLARLADEEGESPATVVDLAHRRRRKAATLLVAAAAVVALGVGVGNLVSATVSGGEDAGSAAEAPEAAASSEDNSLRDGDVDSLSPEGAFSTLVDAGAPQRVRPDFFAEDVARLRLEPAEAEDAPDPESAPPTDGTGLTTGAEAAGFVCDPAAWGEGRLLAVRYAGVPAVLAFRPPAGDTQVVDLLECGTAAILRSVTLPVP